MQAQTEVLKQQSETARNLAASQTGGDTNALMDIMNLYSGYGSPSAVEV